MKERFENRKITGAINVACKYDNGDIRYWNVDKKTVIIQIMGIVKQYTDMGYRLTLRQLHYQLVTRNWIVNHDSAYKKLGNILDDCRYAGLIDWDAIEDRGRVPYLPYYNEGAMDALEDTINQFRIDRQENQPTCIELWTEKDALSGILKRTTSKYHVRLVVNKGYTSSSAIYSSYRRAADCIANGRRFVILYFGDHDPSGLDMVRDIHDRMMLMLSHGNIIDRLTDFNNWWKTNSISIERLYIRGLLSEKHYKNLYEDNPSDESYLAWDAARLSYYLIEEKLFQIIPIGLTKDQINNYNLPENPTKMTDSRAATYVQKHGRVCWEVDALRPETLTQIVEDNIVEHIDADIFNAAAERETKELAKLKKFYDQKIDEDGEA